MFLFCFVNYILAYNEFCVNSFIEKSLLMSKIFNVKIKRDELKFISQ